jgi:peptide/nickel transport system substrate-binding protein
MSKTAKLVFALVIIASLVISACGATPTATPAPTQTPVIVKQTVVVAATPVVQTQVVQVVVTATPVPATPVPTKAPEKAADSVVLALQQEPDTLHAGIGSMMARTIVLAAINVGCLQQDHSAKWIAAGCETVPTLDNGGAKFVGDGADKHLEVTFKIKKGWRWTDGTPVTAKDAVYQWKLYMDPDFEIASRYFYQKLFDVVAVDDATILYKFMSNNQAKAAEAGTLKGNVPFEKYKDDYISNAFSATNGPVVDPLYWNAGGWFPSHILSKVAAKDQAASDYAKKPVGDGAFVVKEWKAGQEIVLTASDKPFPLGDPKIKTITYRFFGETKAVIAALQKGEIDGVTSVAGLTPADAPDLDKIAAAGLYKVAYEPEYSWEHADLNVQKFPLDDVKVRKALYSATDKKSIIDSLYFGKYVAAELPGAVLPTNSWAYTTDFTKYPFDVAKAKALLTEAGWDCKALPCTKKVNNVAKNLEITLMTTDRADRQKLAQVIQSQWKAINVGVNLQFLYGRGLFATCSAGGPLYCRTYDAAIYTWVGQDDPQFMGLYDCSSIPTKENGYSGQNNPGWCNKAADEALIQSETNADVTVSQEKRKPFIYTFFKAWTDEVPVIPFFVNSVPAVSRTGFKNYTCGPTQYAACGWNAHLWELTK